jgi:putative Mn2+ efflux pump MntP
MPLLLATLIAVVSNLDNLAVGFACGIRGTRITPPASALIAAVTMAGTAAAIVSGRALAGPLSPALATWLGGSIVIAIGGWTIAVSLSTVRAPAHASIAGRAVGRGRVISLREALALALALSLNNLGSGVGAGAARVPALLTAVLAGAFSLLFVGGGSLAGRHLGGHVLHRRAQLVGGVALLAAGAAMLPGVR